MRVIGIIGGTGFEDPELFPNFKKQIIDTPYGEASVLTGSLQENRVVFLMRHGACHGVPPHMINYRANIWALKSLGVQEIFATACTGSVNPAMQVGDFVVCDNVLDFTKSRINTFFGDKVVHADFTYPYCEVMRKRVIRNLQKLGIRYHDHGVYVATEGPRFESAAEIKAFAMLGGDVIGMTGMPEAILAREAEMCYTSVAIVCNMGAGIAKELLTLSDITEKMTVGLLKMKQLVKVYVCDNDSVEGEGSCTCPHAIQEFGGFQL